MGTNEHSPDDSPEPRTLREWFQAVVDAPSRWDLGLATIPVAVSVGVLVGGSALPMRTGVALGTGIAFTAIAYVVVSDASG